jgi:hypothetical protein
VRRTTTTHSGCVDGYDRTGGITSWCARPPPNAELQVRNCVWALPATRHRPADERTSAQGRNPRSSRASEMRCVLPPRLRARSAPTCWVGCGRMPGWSVESRAGRSAGGHVGWIDTRCGLPALVTTRSVDELCGLWRRRELLPAVACPDKYDAGGDDPEWGEEERDETRRCHERRTEHECAPGE